MAKELQTPDDIAFIRAILTRPGDVAPRLVYADWLDEHETELTMRAAEFLRMLVAYSQAPAHSIRSLEVQARLGQLQDELPSRWVAVLDVPLIEACKEFRFLCPLQWDQLRTTKDAFVRHCSQCERQVHYCLTLDEAAAKADGGACVALPIGAARKPYDLVHEMERLATRRRWGLGEGEHIVMGMIS